MFSFQYTLDSQEKFFLSLWLFELLFYFLIRILCIWMVLSSLYEYDLLGCCIRLSRIREDFLELWGKVFLGTPAYQDLGYGDDIWVSILCDIRRDIHYALIVLFP